MFRSARRFVPIWWRRQPDSHLAGAASHIVRDEFSARRVIRLASSTVSELLLPQPESCCVGGSWFQYLRHTDTSAAAARDVRSWHTSLWRGIPTARAAHNSSLYTQRNADDAFINIVENLHSARAVARALEDAVRDDQHLFEADGILARVIGARCGIAIVSCRGWLYPNEILEIYNLDNKSPLP